MQIQSKVTDDILTISFNGRLVASCVEDFKSSMLDFIDKNNKICLDLQDMQYIDSSGIGALIHILQKLNDGGGLLTIARLQPKPKIVFDITKVYRIFNIHDSLEEAIEELKKN